MSNQYNQNTNIPAIVEQRNPQTAPLLIPVQEHSQYLKNLHTQATILHHELSQRLTFLGDYIDHVLYVIDFHLTQADSGPGSWAKVVSPAPTLLRNILDLEHTAGMFASLHLQPGLEDWRKLESLTRRIGEFVGRTGWMYLGSEFCEIRAWAGEAEKVLGHGKTAIVWVWETIRKVEEAQGGE